MKENSYNFKKKTHRKPMQRDAHDYKPVEGMCTRCPRKQWQDKLQYPTNWISKFCRNLVTGDAGNLKRGFV
jgi:hypothetical protein